ncbi:MAG: hypothetical protein J6Q54_08310, partial [Oscillospiraceae bacterium]|nr:hypothetical protein [Oscillospiraceae bacterium]
MSQKTLPRENNDSPVARINRFLSTPYYIGIIMLLTVLSNMFGLELIVYSIFISVVVYLAIWGEDFLPLLPIM